MRLKRPKLASLTTLHFNFFDVVSCAISVYKMRQGLDWFIQTCISRVITGHWNASFDISVLKVEAMTILSPITVIHYC